jgi:glycosyltransferase involved in cell wall biosynthesis
MRISVVIPVRNDAAALERCLSALGRQTQAADEIVVVDSGSTDGSAEVAARHGARVLPVEVAGIPGSPA